MLCSVMKFRNRDEKYLRLKLDKSKEQIKTKIRLFELSFFYQTDILFSIFVSNVNLFIKYSILSL